MSATPRRRFLRVGALGVLGATLPMRTTRAHRERALVVVLLRGGLDGLSVLVPYGEDDYYRARPTLAVPPPGRSGGCLRLDGRFGLHPALAPLLPLYREGRMAIIPAAGIAACTRSHFDAQLILERGGYSPRNLPATGWLNRCMAEGDVAATLEDQLPESLRGPRRVVVCGRPRATREDQGFRSATPAFRRLFASADPLARRASRALEAEVRLQRALTSEGARHRPGRSLGAAELTLTATLLRAAPELRIIALDLHGWDTHARQGSTEGPLARNLGQFAESLARYEAQLGWRRDDVVTLVLTEFGRTVAENGTGGTDHGWASVAFVLGDGVRGGRILGSWPGLEADALFEGRDVAVTTDLRRVYAELASDHLGNPWRPDLSGSPLELFEPRS